MTQTIDIHGKPYVTVAGRVEEAHKANKTISITTEIIPADVVLFKATVVTEKGTFTGYSAANPNKPIEKQSPYEVAESSAIGRALGFAGYALTDGIAAAEEMHKVSHTQEAQDVEDVFDTAQDAIEIRTAGPQSKKPGAQYKYNRITKKFVGWVEEDTVNS